MSLCASCWIQFLPAPNSDRASDFSIPTDNSADRQSLPFVWSNRGQADLQRDHFVQSSNSYAEDQASYQRVWLTGKLGALANVRCLHAAQSVDPRELTQLRAWLSRHDRQLAQQPEVDRVLRELGVTHRLVRNQPAVEQGTADHSTTDKAIVQGATQPTQFSWQAIEDPLLLCQVLVSGSATPTTDSEAIWRWTSPGRLVIQISEEEVGYSDGSEIVEGRAAVANNIDAERRATLGPAQDRVLIVRQMNDGGWLARDVSGRLLKIRHEPLFVEIEVSDAVDEIALSRKWFW